MFNNFYEYISNVSFVNINNFTNIIKNLLYLFFNIKIEQKYIVNNPHKDKDKFKKQYKYIIDDVDDEKCEWGWFIFIDE